VPAAQIAVEALHQYGVMGGMALRSISPGQVAVGPARALQGHRGIQDLAGTVEVVEGQGQPTTHHQQGFYRLLIFWVLVEALET
jgi:hypothetical protein